MNNITHRSIFMFPHQIIICICATGNPEGLGPELLETLVKMAPTKEEEIKLRDYKGDMSKLGSAERFLTAVLDVPFAFKRVEVMLYRANFDTEIKYLRDSFKTLEVLTTSKYKYPLLDRQICLLYKFRLFNNKC